MEESCWEFAALRSDGVVITWGRFLQYPDSYVVSPQFLYHCWAVLFLFRRLANSISYFTVLSLVFNFSSSLPFRVSSRVSGILGFQAVLSAAIFCNSSAVAGHNVA